MFPTSFVNKRPLEDRKVYLVRSAGFGAALWFSLWLLDVLFSAFLPVPLAIILSLLAGACLACFASHWAARFAVDGGRVAYHASIVLLIPYLLLALTALIWERSEETGPVPSMVTGGRRRGFGRNAARRATHILLSVLFLVTRIGGIALGCTDAFGPINPRGKKLR